MEEVKHVCSGEGCHHTCMDMHRFCPKSCCLVKCLLIIVVLVGTFASGFAAGTEGGDERSNGRGENEGYRGAQMMGYGDQSQADQNENDGFDESPQQASKNVQVIYRTTTEQPETQKSVTTTATGTMQK
jgi:hypothetical protein